MAKLGRIRNSGAAQSLGPTPPRQQRPGETVQCVKKCLLWKQESLIYLLSTQRKTGVVLGTCHPVAESRRQDGGAVSPGFTGQPSLMTTFQVK